MKKDLFEIDNTKLNNIQNEINKNDDLIVEIEEEIRIRTLELQNSLKEAKDIKEKELVNYKNELKRVMNDKNVNPIIRINYWLHLDERKELSDIGGLPREGELRKIIVEYPRHFNFKLDTVFEEESFKINDEYIFYWDINSYNNSGYVSESEKKTIDEVAKLFDTLEQKEKDRIINLVDEIIKLNWKSVVIDW